MSGTTTATNNGFKSLETELEKVKVNYSKGTEETPLSSAKPKAEAAKAEALKALKAEAAKAAKAEKALKAEAEAEALKALKAEAAKAETPNQKIINLVDATPHSELPELDYTVVKSLDQAVLIIAGSRLENPEEIIDGSISAYGVVYLQIGTKRFKFGQMTLDTLVFDQNAIAKIFKAQFSAEDLLSIKQDALKAWCLNFKIAQAKTKANSTKTKKQERLARSKALLANLGE